MSGQRGYKTESPAVAAQNDFTFTVLHKTEPNEIRDASAESMKAQNTIKEPINEHGSPRS